MKIKFVKGYVVKGDADGRPVYKEGTVHEFVGFVPESYARKYIDRGLAVEYVAPVEKKPMPVVEKIPPVAALVADHKVTLAQLPAAAKFTRTNPRFK